MKIAWAAPTAAICREAQINFASYKTPAGMAVRRSLKVCPLCSRSQILDAVIAAIIGIMMVLNTEKRYRHCI
jgi:hypothetical protein